MLYVCCIRNDSPPAFSTHNGWWLVWSHSPIYSYTQCQRRPNQVSSLATSTTLLARKNQGIGFPTTSLGHACMCHHHGDDVVPAAAADDDEGYVQSNSGDPVSGHKTKKWCIKSDQIQLHPTTVIPQVGRQAQQRTHSNSNTPR